MIYQYNGYEFNRVYIQADSLSEAMSLRHKKALLRGVLENTYCADLDDVRYYYRKLFANWKNPSYWKLSNRCSDYVFLDTAY